MRCFKWNVEGTKQDYVQLFVPLLENGYVLRVRKIPQEAANCLLIFRRMRKRRETAAAKRSFAIGECAMKAKAKLKRVSREREFLAVADLAHTIWQGSMRE